MKHYVVTDAEAREIRLTDVPAKDFRAQYVKFRPHRPRWAERRFGKRVRLYIQRVEEAWYTCSLKYNFDRWRVDCSCTGKGTEDEIKRKLKNYMISRGYREHWWDGFSLKMGKEGYERYYPIECERAVDEIKTEECICAGEKPPS